LQCGGSSGDVLSGVWKEALNADILCVVCGAFGDMQGNAGMGAVFCRDALYRGFGFGVVMRWILPVLVLALARPVMAQHLPSQKVLAVVEAAAATFDGVATRQRIKMGDYEADPVVRPFTGRYPTYQRMVPLGAAEVVACYYLAKRWPKLKWLQVGLAGAHLGAGIGNARSGL